MNHTLRSVVEEELQKAYERGVQDGMKQERALWEMSNIGHEIERVHAVNMSEERVQKTEKNEHEPVAIVQQEAYGRGQVFWAQPASTFQDGTPLYTAPLKKEWVGLTCGDVVDAEQECKHTIDENGNIHFADNADFAHAIEAKLKAKNA